MFKKSWVIVEVTEGSERQEFVTLAGTSDKRAINKVLAALKLYKDECYPASTIGCGRSFAGESGFKPR
jgi:hypothetical protein